MRKIIRSILASLVMLLFIGTHHNAATDQEINDAIQAGLAWLATQQNQTYGYFTPGYTFANTAAAVLAFENEGHFPGGNTQYSGVVEKGLDWLFTRAFKVDITSPNTPTGNPDSDGDGIGVYFYHNDWRHQSYETGMVMQTIIASNTPDRVITTGQCAGMTYRELMEDVVDWCAFAQNDPNTSGRGAWHYWANQGSGDNSTCQWPVLGLIAAEQWGIYAPTWVKDELEYWVLFIQNMNPNDYHYGASGYANSTHIPNISKTGGLLVEQYYLGYDFENDNDNDDGVNRPQIAVDYIEKRWGFGPHGVWYGNKAHPYAMFSVFKGLELMEVTNLPSGLDWWADYADYLVNNQSANGAWGGYYYWHNSMAVGWYIVILQATVFPVQVAVDLPDCACDTGYDVDVHYSVERFVGNGSLEIYKDNVLVETVAIEDFQGSDTYTYTVESDEAGTSEWKAILDITSEGGINSKTENIASVEVCASPLVADIPDQFSPFEVFDLDDYGTAEFWTYTIGENGDGWTVNIDGDNVATVTSPEGAAIPVTITFTANTTCCNNIVCTGSDEATFTPIIYVEFDIKPTSWPNPFNPKSKGKVPAAILGTADFDVSTVDPATLLLEGVAPLRWNYEDVTGPSGSEVCNDTENGADGFMDMTLKFDNQELVGAIGSVASGDELVLTLTGNQLNGTPIEGDDCIIVRGGKGKGNKKAISEISAAIPEEYSLSQNYPNPFNPYTNIRFALPAGSQVLIRVFDILGKEVVTLNDGYLEPGYYEVEFDGSNLNTGVYIYSLRAGEIVFTKKLTLIK